MSNKCCPPQAMTSTEFLAELVRLRKDIADFEADGGIRGYSAYQVAINEGFTGTVEEWLLSLVGPEGEQGIPGPVGPVGPEGDISPELEALRQNVQTNKDIVDIKAQETADDAFNANISELNANASASIASSGAIDAQNSMLGAVQSAQSAAISKANAKISETNAALYAQRADLALIPKGYYNPVTNTSIDGALTNTPNPAFVNGAFYEVDVEGVSQIDGANFNIGDTLHIGDRIEKIGTEWILKPNPITNYALNLDTQEKLKVIAHIEAESTSAHNELGGVVDAVAQTITIPNTLSGDGSLLSFSFTTLNQYNWNIGDVLYLESIVTENIANITNVDGQQLFFKLNVNRNISGVPTFFPDVAVDSGYQRLNPTQVLFWFKYVITTGDIDIVSYLQKNNPGFVNNSGTFWRWTVEEINYHITKSTETLAPISAKLNDLSLQINENKLYTNLINKPLAVTSANGGLVFKNDNRIVIPIGSSGQNTFFWKLIPLTGLAGYKAGDKIEIVFIVSESIPGSMTLDNPPKVSANIWLGTSGGGNRNGTESSKIVRHNANTVKVILTTTIAANDVEFRPGLFINNSVINNTSSNFEFTLLSINSTNLENIPHITNNTDVINEVIDQVNINTQDIKNSGLALVANDTTLDAYLTSGATYSYSDNILTVPVGQTGQGAFSLLIFPISTSSLFSQMIGKIITFELIAEVSTDLWDKRQLILQAVTLTNGTLIGDRAINPEIIYIDSNHLKLKFDCLIGVNDTELRPYLEFTALDVVIGSPQTIQFQNKLYFYWDDVNQKNSNTFVLENAIFSAKGEILKTASSNIYLPIKVLSGGTAEVAGVTVNVNADTITINSGINPGFSFLFKRNVTANYPDWVAGKEIKYIIIIDENQPGISDNNFYKSRLSLNSTIGGVYQQRDSVSTYERLDANTVQYTVTRTILANETSVDIVVSTYGYVNNTGSNLIYTWKNLSYKISDPTDAVNPNSQIIYNLTKRLTTVESIGAGGNAWVGSKIIWCGTSIPFNYQPNSYPDQVGAKLGAIIINTAIGGSKLLFPADGLTPGMAGTIAENTAVNPAFASYSYENTIMQYLGSPHNPRGLVIDHGFNDAKFTPSALGTIASTNKATFYGAYDYVIKAVLAVRPDIKIVLVTFPSRYPFGSTDSAGVANYESLRTAIKAIGDKWGFPVLDLAGLMGYNSITAVAGKYTTDGVHPTVDATAKIADVGYRFLLGVS